MPDPVGQIADRIVEALRNSGATLRIGKVTAAQTDNARVQVDFANAAWIPVDKDVSARVGDRVYVLQQGPVLLVSGKIGAGEGGAPVGSVTPYAGLSTAPLPSGWLLCEGQLVSRTDFALLFERLGTTYGAGDGATTFALPDMRSRVPVGQGGTRALGATGGAETVALATAEMPSHNHGSDGSHSHTIANAGNDVVVASGTGATVAGLNTATSSSAGGHTHASNGSGAAHENMPPFVVLYYIIRAI